MRWYTKLSILSSMVSLVSFALVMAPHFGYKLVMYAGTLEVVGTGTYIPQEINLSSLAWLPFLFFAILTIYYFAKKR